VTWPNVRQPREHPLTRYLLHLEAVVGRKPGTIQDYRLILDRQLAPLFGERPLDRIDSEQVAAFVAAQARPGLRGRRSSTA